MNMVRPHTLQEIAEDLGVSRERVRQIERQALAKVRANLIRQGFEPDDCIDLRDDSNF
jgi:DNA-directed RNA polymerase sigma subunit (sigma70/sigma32)